MSNESPQIFRPKPTPFDDIVHIEEDGTEWWSAREMMEHLGYSQWRNLENVISKARSACRNNGQQPSDHLADVSKMIDIGKGGQRVASDVQLSRYGCYLVAMNGDPDKPEVAAAQRYFALMTRVAEVQAQVLISQPIAPPAPAPWSVRFRETMLPHVRYLNVNHPGCFTVVSTLVAPLLYLEDELIRHLLKPQSSDRPDVSVGIHWANDRKKRGLEPSKRLAPIWLPDQYREVWLKVYDNSERGVCEAWFARRYLPCNLPDYLKNKKSFREFGELPPASAADSTCLGLTGSHAALPTKIRRQLESVGGFFPVGAKLNQLEVSQRSLFD